MSDYNDILDSDQVHSDDIRDEGQALEAVRFISIDYAAVAARNLQDTRARIARHKLTGVRNDI